MKQTAVDWLFEQYKLVGMLTTAQLEKAKEIEKEQMVDATVQYLIKHRGAYSELAISQAVALSEQYYNETFNGNEK